MLVNYFSYLPPVLRRQIEAERLLKVEIIPVKPVLALHIGLAAVHMDRLVSLVRVEEESPSHYEQDCRHTGFGYYILARQLNRRQGTLSDTIVYL